MPAATTTLSIPNVRQFFRQALTRLKTVGEISTRGRLKKRSAVIPAIVWNPWQTYWGEAYGLELKRWLLNPVFERLECEGKIGNLIVDVGSGARPVTRFLQPKEGRKRICVDIAADNCRSADEQRIRLDVEKVVESGALSFRKASARVCKFLEMPPGAREDSRGADTMVFADLLNYVDFRKVLGGFAHYLKPGGRIVIVNLPMRGNESLFSDRGLKDNRDLYGFLHEQRFEIEQKAFPCRDRDETEEAEELIVLVARKRSLVWAGSRP